MPETLGLGMMGCTPALAVLGYAEPPRRSAGVRVETVAELVAKLKNEARVI